MAGSLYLLPPLFHPDDERTRFPLAVSDSGDIFPIRAFVSPGRGLRFVSGDADILGGEGYHVSRLPHPVGRSCLEVHVIDPCFAITLSCRYPSPSSP